MNADDPRNSMTVEDRIYVLEQGFKVYSNMIDANIKLIDAIAAHLGLDK